MAVNTFGVTAATVTSIYFPQVPGFNATTRPTAAAVAVMIDQCAALLEGKLYAENISAAAIVTSTSAAYLMCAEQLGRMVALRVHKVLPQKFPELAKEYQREVDAWFLDLNIKGGTFLGNDELETGTAPADGPTTHVNTYNLTTIAAADMSSAAPRLKADDLL